jgi:hypothetical protein
MNITQWLVQRINFGELDKWSKIYWTYWTGKKYLNRFDQKKVWTKKLVKKLNGQNSNEEIQWTNLYEGSQWTKINECKVMAHLMNKFPWTKIDETTNNGYAKSKFKLK